MTRESQADDKAEKHDKTSATYWIEAFKGTPASIVVPPYIRFLQGTLLLRKAYAFLQQAQIAAIDGNPKLAAAVAELEESKDSKQLGMNFQTFFASHLTINLVSEVEHFFTSAVSAVLRMYPDKMGGQTFKLVEILSSSSRGGELVDRAARDVLNGLMYEKPLDYAKKFADFLSIDMKSLEAQWLAFVELKARRDVGVHNNWVVNEIYLRKLREADIKTTYALGDRVIPDFNYMNRASDACDKLIETLANLLAEKWLPVAEDT
jgi:hypothetical protein